MPKEVKPTDVATRNYVFIYADRFENRCFANDALATEAAKGETGLLKAVAAYDGQTLWQKDTK